ncbi:MULTISPECIES: hypothetical protein [Streptomyces]|uniref:hypothetical protein n=1 Tax=Streptomyces TaxID=1883 RepID=UPI001D139E1C|nr:MULTISPECIES: hypothetical protein [Streptomyces]MCC3655665.1 hypothetical protein [Streptomyces sp. S07_1.15]WSQ70023.1 hypothetical protein OG463_00355 [Streptomyces xinghaiensis]
MGARDKRSGVDTWVHICNEIIHHVLPFRARTVHLLWVVTIPPMVLGGFLAVVVLVLIPNPYGWFGVAGCGAGVLLTARLRAWLRPPLRGGWTATGRSAASGPGEAAASGDVPGEEEAPTSLPPP